MKITFAILASITASITASAAQAAPGLGEKVYGATIAPRRG